MLTEILLGVSMFTAVVLLLVVVILFARRLLVPQGDIEIEINGDPDKTLTVKPGGSAL